MPPIVQRSTMAHSGSYNPPASGGAVVVTLLMFFDVIVEVKSIFKATSYVGRETDNSFIS